MKSIKKCKLINASQVLKNFFQFDFHMKGKPFQFDELKLCKTNLIFSLLQMEKFTLKAGSVFLSEAFQFITEK